MPFLQLVGNTNKGLDGRRVSSMESEVVRRTRKPPYRFDAKADLELLKQVLRVEPYKAKFGSTQDKWTKISNILGNKYGHETARKRFAFLINEFRMNGVPNLRSQGSECEVDERDKLLDILNENVKEAKEIKRRKKLQALAAATATSDSEMADDSETEFEVVEYFDQSISPVTGSENVTSSSADNRVIEPSNDNGTAASDPIDSNPKNDGSMLDDNIDMDNSDNNDGVNLFECDIKPQLRKYDSVRIEDAMKLVLSTLEGFVESRKMKYALEEKKLELEKAKFYLEKKEREEKMLLDRERFEMEKEKWKTDKEEKLALLEIIKNFQK